MPLYQLLAIFALQASISDSTGDVFSHQTVIGQYDSDYSVISKAGISCDVRVDIEAETKVRGWISPQN